MKVNSVLVAMGFMSRVMVTGTTSPRAMVSKADFQERVMKSAVSGGVQSSTSRDKVHEGRTSSFRTKMFTTLVEPGVNTPQSMAVTSSAQSRSQ